MNYTGILATGASEIFVMPSRSVQIKYWDERWKIMENGALSPHVPASLWLLLNLPAYSAGILTRFLLVLISNILLPDISISLLIGKFLPFCLFIYWNGWKVQVM